jgi:hypothetical protein
VTTTMSTRIAAGVTAEYLLDLSRDAAPRSRPAGRRRAAHRPARRPGAARPPADAADAAALTYASRRARLGATRGGSSGCLG